MEREILDGCGSLNLGTILRPSDSDVGALDVAVHSLRETELPQAVERYRRHIGRRVHRAGCPVKLQLSRLKVRAGFRSRYISDFNEGFVIGQLSIECIQR